MNRKGKVFLVSIDFRSSLGGIARLSNLIYDSLSIDKVFSLRGKSTSVTTISYFNNHKFSFLFQTLIHIYFNRPQLLIFDHINIARLLVLVPSKWVEKIVIYLHDEEAWSKNTGLRKIALTKASCLLCNSDFTRKKFLEKNPAFALKSSTCHPGGVTTCFLHEEQNHYSRYNSWFLDKRPYCLFVSRLWKVHRFKGYIELLQAFSNHYRNTESPYLRLAIVGKGDDEEEIRNFITSENLVNHIELFNDTEDLDLKALYENSLCLFFPSTREGFGMVYLEAMYFGKACIGVKGQPAEEIIIDRETGLLLPNNHPKELEKIIEDMELNEEKYILMGEAGKERYTSYFSAYHFKKRFLKAINSDDPL